MQEFSSVTASSYDAESLAPMLTAKANEGWSVVSIVSAGTNVVAYLSREAGTGAAPAPADVTAEVPVAAEPVAAAAPTTDWSSSIGTDATAATAVAAEATPISPTLPGEVTTPSIPDAMPVSTPEAVAAVEASGEPAGWGAVPAADTTTDSGGPSLGGIATGVGVAGAGVAAAAAPVDDAMSGLSGGVAGATEAASDTFGGIAEQASGAVESATGADLGGAAEAAEAAVADTAAAAEATTEAAAASGVPAGWYADPSGRFELRYWDGNAWTEHVSRAGQQYTDPPVA